MDEIHVYYTNATSFNLINMWMSTMCPAQVISEQKREKPFAYSLEYGERNR